MWSQLLKNDYFEKTVPWPRFLLLSMMPYGMDYPFSQFESAVSPPNLLPISRPLAGRAEWETEEAFMLCKHCSEIAVQVLLNNS